MAGIAIAGAVGAFADVVRGRVPVIGRRVEMFHLDPGGGECIAHCWNQPQRGQGLFVPGASPQHHPGTGRGMAAMTIVAIAVSRSGVAAVAGHLAVVLAMGDLRGQLSLPARLVAVLQAGRSFTSCLDA